MKYLICLLILAGCASSGDFKKSQERAKCVKIMTKTEAGAGSCY